MWECRKILTDFKRQLKQESDAYMKKQIQIFKEEGEATYEKKL